MKPCHFSEAVLLAPARGLNPAQPAASAIKPISIPFFTRISLGAVARLARPDLHEARAIPAGISGSRWPSLRRHERLARGALAALSRDASCPPVHALGKRQVN
jgi:hypothetical protein